LQDSWLESGEKSRFALLRPFHLDMEPPI